MVELQTVWGWQPALYLFLGGMGAGAFIMAAILQLRGKGSCRKIVAISLWAAVICLVVGLLCLVLELTNPVRGMMLWQSFSHFTSWMTFGAWIVFAAVVVFGLAALCATDATAALIARVWKGFPEKREHALNVLSVAGMLLGACVAVYTGILLMSAPGVPLWNTPLLPALFTVSALDTGIALVEIVVGTQARKEHVPRPLHVFMNASVVCLVLIEAIVLAALLLSMASGSGAEGSWAATGACSAELLASSTLAPFFWVLVVVCGLALPLAAAAFGLVRQKRAGDKVEDGDEDASRAGTTLVAAAVASGSGKVTLVGAVGALVGGCALRFLIVMAGIHADAVSDAVAQVFADMLARLS